MDIASLNIRQDVSLKDFTTLKVGGLAEYFVEVSSLEQLNQATKWAQQEDLLVTIIGEGSNILVSDQGLRGLVIRVGIKGIESEVSGDEITLWVGAGEILDEVIATTVEKGWWGLENLSAIPGSVGAAPVQNVGAYGTEVSSLIEGVEVLDTTDLVTKVFSKEECTFGYRDSIFKTNEGKKYIITTVIFKLSNKPNPVLSYRDLNSTFPNGTDSQSNIREAVISIRGGKFPDWRSVGTAGSFFKNPVISKHKYEELLINYPELPAYPVSGSEVKLPLGYVLDKILDLKGYEENNVGTYEGQALVVVTKSNATAIDIENFAVFIQDKVNNELGIKVEWEVTKLG